MTNHTGTLVPFNYGDVRVRVVTIEGEPWLVASDIARALEYRDAHNLTRGLDADEKGTQIVSTPSGDQSVTVISESGFYTAAMRSRSERAGNFRRWVTREVLPSIRKTGGYQSAPALPTDRTELLALAVLEATAALEEKDKQIAVLAPKAEVADRFLDATGDYSVKDAAGALTRAGVKVGQQRLFGELETRKWIFRGKGDGRWRPYQSALEGGWVSVIPQSHYHPKTGVLVLDAPQIRVTAKGVQRIASDYGVLDLGSVTA